MDRFGEGFQYLNNKFRGTLTDAKIEAGVFTGPQIRRIVSDVSFSSSLNEKELRAWTSFVEVTENFLSNFKSPNYSEIINNMLAAYELVGYRMSLKIHFPLSHLDFFPRNPRSS